MNNVKNTVWTPSKTTKIVATSVLGGLVALFGYGIVVVTIEIVRMIAAF